MVVALANIGGMTVLIGIVAVGLIVFGLLAVVIGVVEAQESAAWRRMASRRRRQFMEERQVLHEWQFKTGLDAGDGKNDEDDSSRP